MTRSAGRHPSADEGYALLELLLSTLIACVVLGVLLQLAVAAQNATRAHEDATDLQQRLRVATEAIYFDLVMAGAAPSDGSLRGGLIGVLPPIVPARTGTRAPDAELSQYTDRISILYVPEPSFHTRIRVGMGAPGAPLAIDTTAPGCGPGEACGFSAGDRAIVFDAVDPPAAYDIFTVSATSTGSLMPQAPLSQAYAAGSPVMRIVQRVYSLDRAANRLMVYDGDTTDLPLAEHVVDLRITYYAEPSPGSVPPPETGRSNCVYAGVAPPTSLLADLGGSLLKPLTPTQMSDGPVCGVPPHRFDADLLRVRRIRVAIRLEAEGSEFRGSGARFLRAGIASGSAMEVPDQQVIIDVTPRSLNLFR